ncbi:MAG TPA: allantoinase AllB [Flavobacteriales bacterium]|nr:allantoinase AllB [Flavobacteriales bacterium]HQW31431.1 allantoinase AllB [Flavobacteriales bacterium]HQY01369.1 allantoinase AllB [Flavobacteriales bacterium]HQY80244.1 allantoinase AllB [Flavobacteriales bacterium]HRA17553.1 allantoinase AllB [Flavobacteriales bacterium]
METALHSTRVITPTGVVEATLLLAEGKITDVLPGKIQPEGIPYESVGNKVIIPGVIDAHVHINEPGRTEWEGFETATKAAAAGGTTTLIEMPLNASPVTTTAAALKLKLEAAKGKLHVNCGFYGGVIPTNIDELDELLKSGVFGIKAFLTHSGIDEFPSVTEADLRKALPILKKHNAKLLVHCELEGVGTMHASSSPDSPDSARSYALYLASRPTSWETDAIALMIRLSEEYDVHVHIVHVSAAEALPLIRAAKKRGLRITAETCPHYLVFCAEDIPDGATEYKCAPPIRERANNELLWEALKDGTLDFVATDHSPAPPDIKEQQSGDFMKAWGGIAGLQFLLSAFWTGAKERGFSLEDVARLLCEHPADFLGMKKKGRIAPGCDADLVIWDPEASFVVKTEDVQHRHKLTPYVGRRLNGVVERTVVGGSVVLTNGRFTRDMADPLLAK